MDRAQRAATRLAIQGMETELERSLRERDALLREAEGLSLRAAELGARVAEEGLSWKELELRCEAVKQMLAKDKVQRKLDFADTRSRLAEAMLKPEAEPGLVSQSGLLCVPRDR
jgi:hypothetical protein